MKTARNTEKTILDKPFAIKLERSRIYVRNIPAKQERKITFSVVVICENRNILLILPSLII